MNQKTRNNQPKETDIHVGICPYYIRDRGNGVIYCECAKFHFPDKAARREILYGYCAHPDNYKKCVLKQMLDHFYERKYQTIATDMADATDVATTPKAPATST